MVARAEKKKLPVGRMLFIVGRDVVFCYVGALAVLFVIQRWLIFPTSHDMSRTPADQPYRLQYEDVHLSVPGGYMTNAWFVPSAGAKHTVLFCRGNGGTLSDWIDVMQMFHEMGFNILVFDYGGYGKSTGRPSEQRLYDDARAAWHWLTDERKIPASEIVIVGHSIGGGVASQLATEVKPAGLILQSTFTSLPDVCQERLWFMPVKWLVRDKFRTASKLARLECPVLIAHSPQDSIIPYAHGRKLFELAHEPKQFLELRGDHNDGMFASGPQYTDTVRRFIEK